MLGTLRWKGVHDPEKLAEKLDFTSVEEMHDQFKDWKLPDWLVGAETSSGKKKVREKSTASRLRNIGPRKDLPTASNATELFKERLEALLESVALLEHVDEGLHGKYFAQTNVETATVLFPWEHLSEEGREAIRKQGGTDGEDFTATGVPAAFPGKVAKSPSESLAVLIGVYALAGGRMDLLLEKLHLDSASVNSETRTKIHQLVEGTRRGKGTKDSLIVLARQLAALVRGGEVTRGRPPELPDADYAVASITTKYRKQGLTDEEITRKVAHLKREDGTSYSTEDITELGDMGLSWP